MYRLYIRLGLPSDHLCMISALALLSDIRILVMTWTLRIFLRYVPMSLGLGHIYQANLIFHTSDQREQLWFKVAVTHSYTTAVLSPSVL